MSTPTNDIGFVSIVIACVLAFGMIAGVFIGSQHFKRQAIEQGCAHYDPQTGNWEWGTYDGTEQHGTDSE